MRALAPPGTSSRIVNIAAMAAGVPVDDVLGGSITRAATAARYAAAWAMKKHTKHSLTEIGRRLGGRNHSTIIRALRWVDDDIAAGGARFGGIVAKIEARLG